MVCYGVDDEQSFENCDSWREEFEEIIDTEKATVMLVGCKMDLVDARVVTVKRAKEKLQGKGWRDMNCLPAECSSKTGRNVDNIFLAMAEMVRVNRDDNFIQPATTQSATGTVNSRARRISLDERRDPIENGCDCQLL